MHFLSSWAGLKRPISFRFEFEQLNCSYQRQMYQRQYYDGIWTVIWWSWPSEQMNKHEKKRKRGLWMLHYFLVQGKTRLYKLLFLKFFLFSNFKLIFFQCRDYLFSSFVDNYENRQSRSVNESDWLNYHKSMDDYESHANFINK